MTDVYLKFPDKETFDSFSGVRPFEVLEEEGNTLYSEGWSIDIIGSIHTFVGYDEVGDQLFEKLDGWHVNLRSDMELPDEFTQYQVFPVDPVRTWA